MSKDRILDYPVVVRHNRIAFRLIFPCAGYLMYDYIFAHSLTKEIAINANKISAFSAKMVADSSVHLCFKFRVALSVQIILNSIQFQ